MAIRCNTPQQTQTEDVKSGPRTSLACNNPSEMPKAAQAGQASSIVVGTYLRIRVAKSAEKWFDSILSQVGVSIK